MGSMSGLANAQASRSRYDGQSAATSPDRSVEHGCEVRARGRGHHQRDRPDADPDGGWVVRRHAAKTSVTSLTTTATTRSQGDMCQVIARLTALNANATRYIAASTTRSRRRRCWSGAWMTTPGSVERSHPDRLIKRAVAPRAIGSWGKARRELRPAPPTKVAGPPPPQGSASVARGTWRETCWAASLSP